MNDEKKSSRLLVIDSDAQLVRALTQHFDQEGYQVMSAQSGADALTRAQADRPHLILLAARLEDMPGLDVFHKLRDMPRTSHIPVMILAGRSEALLQNKILEAGAYDFIEKPVDVDILALRVRNALRRAEREGLTEPRTGLPTDRLIHERLDALDQERGWYRIDLTITGFNDFRDLYGFVTANEALRFAGNLIAQLVNEHGSPRDFVGHRTGTEDFVVVTQLAQGTRLQTLLQQRVTQELESFYNFEERDRGYVLIEKGAGESVQKPLMAVRMQVVQGDPDPDAGETHADDDDSYWVDVDQDAQPDTTGDGDPFDW